MGDVSQLHALQIATHRAGSQAALGRICGRTQPTVWHWLNRAKRLPAQHVLQVEEATGVSRHALRPDIYPVDDPLKSAAA